MQAQNHRFKNIILLVGLLISIIILVTSCMNEDVPEPNLPNLRTLSAVEEIVVSSSNDFAFDLMSKVNAANPNENVFISPFSVSAALGMTLNGAEGDTETAMKGTLGLNGLSDIEINTAYRDLVTLLLTTDRMATLEIANSVWYSNLYTIKSAFKQILLDNFDAEVNAADFSDPTLKDRINNWIAEKTHDRIKDMLDGVSPDAVMYLINAIYFKADWTYQFDKNKTEDAPFNLEDGSSIMVPTMYSEGALVGLTYDEQYTLVDIPYGNGQFNFTVVMPTDISKINEAVAAFSGDDLANLLADTIQRSVEVYMPKFKIEFKELLNEALIEMGMGVAFDSGSADFSELFEGVGPGLSISRVIHQSFLEVNEEGSEAAAATIVEIELTSAGPSGPASVHINSPFLFFIREKHTNTILFSGKLMEPEL